MSIHSITTSFTPVALDTDSLKSSKVGLDKLYSSLDSFYLTPLKEQVNTLKKQQRNVDNSLRELLVTVPAELQLASIKRLFTEVGSDPRDIDLTTAELSEIVADSREYLGNKIATFGVQLDLLKYSTLSDVSSYLETNQQQSKAEQTLRLAQETAVSEIMTQKEVLNNAMRVMEDKTIWDEWLPVVKGIAHLDPKNPAKSLIKAAVEGATNILRIASESVTYANLVEARKVLEGRMDEHHQRIGTHTKQMDTLSREKSQLDNFQAIASHKRNYEAEVEKVLTTLTLFQGIQQLTQDNPLDRARSYVLQGETLSRYLQDIRNLSR